MTRTAAALMFSNDVHVGQLWKNRLLGTHVEVKRVNGVWAHAERLDVDAERVDPLFWLTCEGLCEGWELLADAAR